jgi:hypothetical protein
MSLYFPRHRSYRHFFFQSPRSLQLTMGDKQTDRYYKDILGGIGLSTFIPGSLNYRCVAEILLSLHGYYIYTCGNVAYHFIRSNLPYSRLTDIQTVSAFVYPPTLPPAGCGMDHPPRYCSFSKIRAVKEFCCQNFN